MNGLLYQVSGLSENLDDYERNYEIICAAIEKCRLCRYEGILLPEGTYAIYNQKALDLRKKLLTGEISATDYARWIEERNVVFNVKEMETFSIIGNHTKLLFDGLLGAFDFTNVKRAILQGISLDWLHTFYFTATVEHIENDEIIAKTNTALAGGEPIVSFQNYDLKTGIQKGMCVFEGVSNVYRKENGTISFYCKDNKGLSVNDGIIARYLYNFAPVIHFYCCEEVVVEDVTVHSGCGMGVVAHKCGDLTFEKYRNVPSGEQKMSTNTDATHFINCYGDITFCNCEFEAMGDDAVNVHGFYMTIKKIIDSKNVVAVIEAASQDGILATPDSGDEVEFSRRDTLLPYGQNRIVAVGVDEGQSEILLEFQDEIPESVKIGDCIGNTSKVARLTVENCTVKNIRGRAMLIQTRDVMIANNLFQNCTGQGVHIDTATGWWESIGTRNVRVISNKFIDCGYGLTKYCDAVGVVVEVEAEKAVEGVHKNIMIQDNYIQGENTGIKASGVEGLTLKGNVFVGCQKEYEISCCKDVKILEKESDDESTE